VEGGADARAIQRPAREGDRASLHRRVPRVEGAGHLSVRGLRDRALLVRHEVRVRHGLAKLLGADERGCGRDGARLGPPDAADRGALRRVRWPSWPCLPGRAAPDRAALLHQLLRARARPSARVLAESLPDGFHGLWALLRSSAMSQVQPYSAQQHDPQAEEQRLPPSLVHGEGLSAPGFSSASLWPAIGGALAAAIVGGIVWGRVLVETDYEVGFLAGPGLRLGLRGADLHGRRARNEGADDRRGRGRARNPDRQVRRLRPFLPGLRP
jgi:hypothetical protein